MHVHRIRTLKKLVSVRENVNSLVFEFGYRFGHYCQTSSWYYEKLSPQHIASACRSNVNSKTADIRGFYARHK